MAFVQNNELRYYSFDLFQDLHLSQGIFTRKGGVSPEPWASLNLGGTQGDDREHVIENRRRIFEQMGRPVESIFDVWQVHSTRVICTREPRPLESFHQEADAILTDNPQVTLFMRFADCVPVFVCDPQRQVVGIVHAGWKGTVHQILKETLQRMVDQYGSKPENILAGIGPSICQKHYEVGDEVIREVVQAYGSDASGLLLYREGRAALDLWAANRLTLERAGVEPEHIEISGLCTYENQQDWFSHRGEHGKTGRFGALLGLG